MAPSSAEVTRLVEVYEVAARTRHRGLLGKEPFHKQLSQLREYFERVFDNAPIMMHSIDRDGRLVNVNRLWLKKLGYERKEVVGLRSTDFLTQESRARAVKDTLPLFWRTGSARSLGYQFVRKDGRVIDVLLDAEVIDDMSGNVVTIATLRDDHGLLQWRQASALLKALVELTHFPIQAHDHLKPGPMSTSDLNVPIFEPAASDRRGSKMPFGEPLSLLTRRELEVLRSLALGHRNKEIAAQLSVSVHTVRFHIENIYQKLGVHTRIQAIRAANEHSPLNIWTA